MSRTRCETGSSIARAAPSGNALRARPLRIRARHTRRGSPGAVQEMLHIQYVAASPALPFHPAPPCPAWPVHRSRRRLQTAATGDRSAGTRGIGVRESSRTCCLPPTGQRDIGALTAPLPGALCPPAGSRVLNSSAAAQGAQTSGSIRARGGVVPERSRLALVGPGAGRRQEPSARLDAFLSEGIESNSSSLDGPLTRLPGRRRPVRRPIRPPPARPQSCHCAVPRPFPRNQCKLASVNSVDTFPERLISHPTLSS
jgi:hypothetical protein